MKSLLRLVLSSALVANVFLGFAVDRNGLEIALSVVSSSRVWWCSPPGPGS